MLYFPQLSSGAVAQYPVRKQSVQRTVVNQLADGRNVKLADYSAAYFAWQLQFVDLSDSEMGTLQQFWASSEGQLNAFTFLDPTDNLFTWSESLGQPSWQASPLLQLTTGIDDASGGQRATRIMNNSGADLTIQQAINGPGWFSYCFSVYVRSQSASTVSLFQQSGSAASSSVAGTSSSWSRASLGSRLQTTSGSLTAGVVIRAGQTIDLFGCQLEPQPAASTYKQTFSVGGVHTSAHFSDDTFEVTTSAPNRSRCTVGITAR